ncbi:hypothetical protein HK097_010522 [Rhizophlyctis rosea]|uniref:Uncharacterized protein n=1 Tax=Rhizophlyctis rosea TaxID=64517 RepID=A0AAD5SK98_9FUNG|nr:hypothetical protein HK097_010522 [Rhizophlyctis rosea]
MRKPPRRNYKPRPRVQDLSSWGTFFIALLLFANIIDILLIAHPPEIENVPDFEMEHPDMSWAQYRSSFVTPLPTGTILTKVQIQQERDELGASSKDNWIGLSSEGKTHAGSENEDDIAGRLIDMVESGKMLESSLNLDEANPTDTEFHVPQNPARPPNNSSTTTAPHSSHPIILHHPTGPQNNSTTSKASHASHASDRNHTHHGHHDPQRHGDHGMHSMYPEGNDDGYVVRREGGGDPHLHEDWSDEEDLVEPIREALPTAFHTVLTRWSVVHQPTFRPQVRGLHPMSRKRVRSLMGLMTLERLRRFILLGLFCGVVFILRGMEKLRRGALERLRRRLLVGIRMITMGVKMSWRIMWGTVAVAVALEKSLRGVFPSRVPIDADACG